MMASRQVAEPLQILRAFPVFSKRYRIRYGISRHAALRHPEAMNKEAIWATIDGRQSVGRCWVGLET
jgi:hypothetical protein